MTFIVIAYDIENDRRRTKIHRVLKDYGKHVQYSLFECLLSAADLQKLRKKLQRLLDPTHPKDSIRYYTLCQSCVTHIETDGADTFEAGTDFYIS